MKAGDVPQNAAFDRTLTLQIDRIIVQLDQRPGWPRAIWLRTQKRIAERRVPGYMPKGGGQ